ncbi:MAG TPA: hypothetical protein VGQ83_02805 [Polyangia bacterium]|jgi:hypothetical protein
MKDETTKLPRPRLFFGFEYRDRQLAVVALDGAGRVCLQAAFPLPDVHDDDLAADPAASVAATLTAFVRSYGAAAVCGIDDTFAGVAALARQLADRVRHVTSFELERWRLSGLQGLTWHDPRVEAHQRALFAALAVAAGDGP